MRRLIALAFVIAAAPATAKTLAIVTPPNPETPVQYGIGRLEAAFRAKGWTVSNSGKADARIEIKKCALNPESYSLTGGPSFTLCAADARGAMYGLLDMADRASWIENPLASIRPVNESPYLRDRAVSMYTMQRAWVEQRLYDRKYWERYFDLLAASRINRFIVIFGYENGGYMAPIYPYFFDVPEFSGVQVVGLSKEQQEKNTASLHAMIAVAHERGIDVTAAIWDHIYRGGVQGGGIEGASQNAGKRVAGLVWGVTTENLNAYTKAALRQFLKTFPDIDSLQFRMHDESGLKPSEMQAFWHEVFADFKKARPDMPVDIRAKGLPDSIIQDALQQKLNIRVNTKYWMEQMGMPFHPTHVNRENQKDRRHGYADMLRYPKQFDIQWQLWNGGPSRLLLWGDPEYVRRFVKSARVYDGHGMEINEALATKMLGEPHDAKPVEILNPAYRYYDYEFERYWQLYRLFGRLAYNPDALPEVWQHEFTKRFGKGGAEVESALETASRILPRIVSASYPYNFFPTTRGWAEMMRLGDLPKFYQEHTTDTEQFQSAGDRAKDLIAGVSRGARTPEQTSEWFAATARTVLAKVIAAEQSATPSKELTSTLTDLRILAHLAEYHSSRLQAAVQYALWKETKNPAALDAAIGFEKRGVAAWERMVESAGDVYGPSLPFGYRAGFPRHWKQELEKLQAGVAALEKERVGATGGKPLPPVRVAGTPPAVVLPRLGPASEGRAYTVQARVLGSPAATVRLHYRHLNQYEDYVVTDMTPKNGKYEAAIPAEFIDKKWSLMYFVEAIDAKGNGRLYPDLEVEQPYVIVPVSGSSRTQHN